MYIRPGKSINRIPIMYTEINPHRGKSRIRYIYYPLKSVRAPLLRISFVYRANVHWKTGLLVCIIHAEGTVRLPFQIYGFFFDIKGKFQRPLRFQNLSYKCTLRKEIACYCKVLCEATFRNLSFSYILNENFNVFYNFRKFNIKHKLFS